MKKTCNVILLPTDEKTTYHGQICLSTNGNIFLGPEANYLCSSLPQHLYITSDEEIKEDDKILYNIHCSYGLNDFNTFNEKCIITKYNKAVHPNIRYCYKIVATTDSSLLLPEISFKDWNGNSRNLPQIPQSFITLYIEEYNKGNKIEKIEVEYELDWSLEEDAINFPNLKINPDNTISISPIKESWNREEVINLFHEFYNECAGYGTYVVNLENWIKQNLS